MRSRIGTYETRTVVWPSTSFDVGQAEQLRELTAAIQFAGTRDPVQVASSLSTFERAPLYIIGKCVMAVEGGHDPVVRRPSLCFDLDKIL